MEAPPPGSSPFTPRIGRGGQELHPSCTFANPLRLSLSAARRGKEQLHEDKVSRGYYASRVLTQENVEENVIAKTQREC